LHHSLETHRDRRSVEGFSFERISHFISIGSAVNKFLPLVSLNSFNSQIPCRTSAEFREYNSGASMDDPATIISQEESATDLLEHKTWK
jgi:hypothetical protein